MTTRSDAQTALRNAQPQAHTFIVPAKAAQPTLPDPHAESIEIQRLRAALTQAQAEADALRAKAKIADELRQIIIDAPRDSWTPGDKIIAAAMVLTAQPAVVAGGYREVPYTASGLAVVVGLSTPPARKAIQRLKDSGMVHYKITRTPVNQYGEPLPPGVKANKERGDTWETTTTLAIRPMTKKLPELGEVASQAKDRERAQAKRDELVRLRAAMVVIEAATCPHCGIAHGLTVVCRECGTFTKAKELPQADAPRDDDAPTDPPKESFFQTPTDDLIAPTWNVTQMTDQKERVHDVIRPDAIPERKTLSHVLTPGKSLSFSADDLDPWGTEEGVTSWR